MSVGKQLSTSSFLIFLVITLSGLALAEQKIDSIYPTVGKIGNNLEASIQGSGFDKNTKISVYPDLGNRHNIIGSLDLLDYAYAIEVKDGTAYVANGDSGLQVIDVSDPSMVVIVATLNMQGKATDVSVVGDTVYVADSEGYLWIIDVSVPSIPAIISSLKLPGRASVIKVEKNTAFVALENPYSLKVIDVGDPNSPVIFGSVDMPGYISEMAIYERQAFVANSSVGYNRLIMVDLSNLHERLRIRMYLRE